MTWRMHHLDRLFKKMENEMSVVSDARGKLWDDYRKRYGTDPKYVKWDDRARPNPMRERYPIPSR